MVAAAIIGAGALSAGAGLVGSSQSASAANAAANTNKAAQQWEEGQVGPFVAIGNLAENQLWNETRSDTNPGGAIGVSPSLTGADISQMPGYQFTQQQGLLATQNAAAAQGLGVSGNALAGAAQYATNLASTNYQQYFNDFWANQNNRYNQLMGMVQTGTNAAVGAGSNVAASAAAAGQQQAAAGQAAAAGTVGAGSSVSNALVANALLGNQTGSTLGANPTSSFGSAGNFQTD